ncbi:MAG: hypothetical protein P8Y40_07225 [Desulfobacterales bacterium]
MDPAAQIFPNAVKKIKYLQRGVLLVGLHSVLLGMFIFFFTERFYMFFFGVMINNPFFVRQAGLFLFCLGLFYLLPIKDLRHRHRVIDIIIVTKFLAVLFLLSHAYWAPRPAAIFLAAVLDAAMAILLIYLSVNAGLFLKFRKRNMRKSPVVSDSPASE